MTLSISKTDLCAVTGGSLLLESAVRLSATGVEYDSREVRGGELFVALKGDKNHGHEFLRTAFDRGAALFLVESKEVAKYFPEPHRLIVVSDSLKAFWELATWWRTKLALPILAITGSVGKTTVKEITASILLQNSRGSFSLKSYNNHVGVPYSICKAGTEHAWAVLELGMNHAGEIHQLTKIAKPSVAAITIVAPAHIEMLGSLEAIARAKLEICDGLAEGSFVILNGMDRVLLAEAKLQKLDERFKLLYFGETGRNFDAEVDNVKGDGESISFKLQIQGEVCDVVMNSIGIQNAMNGACAALSARALIPSLTIDQIRKGLSEFKAPLQRLAVKEISGGRKIVDDAYNANPLSMKALLKLGEQYKSNGKNVGVVLADMLELGEFADKYHLEVGSAVAELKPDFLITVGEKSILYEQEPKKIGVQTFHADSAELAGILALKLNFDILLVKGSRGMKLEKTVSTIIAREGGCDAAN